MLKKGFRGLLIFIAVLAIIYVVLAILAEPAADHPFYSEGPLRPWVIAHQGGDGLWPSDTLFAFEQAAEKGVDMLEMDMHSTSDGVLVLMHDSTVDRTTNGTGRINELTLAEIKALDAGYNWTADEGQTYPFRGMGIAVPTLEEVFTAFPDFRMNIEIKQAEPAITQPFCQMIRDYHMENQVLVPSFDQETINDFRQICPEVATSAGESEVIVFYILSRLFLEKIYTPKATALQVPETRFGLTVLSQRFIDAANKRNLEVHPWTIDEEADMERLLEMGVDGIITDRPDRMMELLGRS